MKNSIWPNERVQCIIDKHMYLYNTTYIRSMILSHKHIKEAEDTYLYVSVFTYSEALVYNTGRHVDVDVVVSFES